MRLKYANDDAPPKPTRKNKRRGNTFTKTDNTVLQSGLNDDTRGDAPSSPAGIPGSPQSRQAPPKRDSVVPSNQPTLCRSKQRQETG